jgi:sugar phosphate isomerase/epimerase
MLFGAMNFPVKPVAQELETIAELGFDYLELTMDPPEAHHTVVREQRDDLMQALERHGMRLVCHLPSFLFTADLSPALRAASVDELIATLDVAASLDPMKVVLHPSYVTGLGSFVADRAKKYGLKSLESIVGHADRLGLTLCLENMFPRANSLTSPDDFVEVLERFPSLMLTLDTGHANIGSKGAKRCLEFLSRFPDRIKHVHASDNFGKDDNHLPIGAGTIEFPRIMKRLAEIGYDETITLEVFSRDKDYLRISREKLAAMVGHPDRGGSDAPGE